MYVVGRNMRHPISFYFIAGIWIGFHCWYLDWFAVIGDIDMMLLTTEVFCSVLFVISIIHTAFLDPSTSFAMRSFS